MGPQIAMIENQHSPESLENVALSTQQDGELRPFAVHLHEVAFGNPVFSKESGEGKGFHSFTELGKFFSSGITPVSQSMEECTHSLFVG